MAKQGYAFQGYNPELMARVVGTNLRISTKQAIAVCSWLRKKNLHEAQQMLQDVMAQKQPVPFKRFTNGLGHKRGMASGRYPFNTSREVLKLLNSAEVNAQNKGLNTGNLVIEHICAHAAYRSMHFGRQIRRQNKASHVEVVVLEGKKTTKPKAGKKGNAEKPKAGSKAEPAAPKADVKPTAPEAKPAAKPPVKETPKAEEKIAPKEPKPEAKVKEEKQETPTPEKSESSKVEKEAKQ